MQSGPACGVTLVQFALTSLDANGKIPKTSFQKVDIQIRRDDIGLIRQVYVYLLRTKL